MMMEVYIRNIVKMEDKGKIYLLFYKERLEGTLLGEIQIKNGQSDHKIEWNIDSINEIEGIGICLDSGIYIASCWKDKYADEILRGEIFTEQMTSEEEVLKPMMYSDFQQTAPLNNIEESVVPESAISYEKIDLSQIRDLPSPNWHLATNSFLVHGFWNYGYLVLKKNVEENQKTLSLGVPGIYEKPEAVMAMLFGFPDFEVVSSELVESTIYKEKNQETEVGTFGCWFVDLKL